MIPGRFLAYAVRIAFLAGAAAPCACVAYEAQNIDDATVLRDLDARDIDARPAADALSYADACARLAAAGPSLREARRALAEAAALEAAGPRRQNPSISAGPLLLDGPGFSQTMQRGLQVTLGYTLDFLSGRLGIARDIDIARRVARAARVRSTIWEAEAKLRRLWLEAGFLRTERSLLERHIKLSASIAARTQRLASNGRGSAIDVRLAMLEKNEALHAVRNHQAKTLENRTALAMHLGCSLGRLGTLAVAELPRISETAGPHVVAEARRPWLGHPRLAALRAEHALREQELRLEVRKQYPMLQLSPSLEREGRVDRWGLLFGVQLPLLDRNTRNIERARANRETARERYLDAARTLATKREAAISAREIARNALETAAAQSRATHELLELSRAAVNAGALKPWRALDIARRNTTQMRHELLARRNVYQSLLRIERSTGAQLLSFTHEKHAAPADQ